VRYSRRDVSGRSAPDWSQEEILPISGYAAVLVCAIAAEGDCPPDIGRSEVYRARFSFNRSSVSSPMWSNGACRLFTTVAVLAGWRRIDVTASDYPRD